MALVLRISPALANLPTINSNTLADLQGNLKDLSEKNYKRLRKSLDEHGFIIPLFVWFDPATGTPYTLDGNQRLRFMRKEYPAGIDLPYVLVEAPDKVTAKKIILLISSQYGETTKEGFDEFMADIYSQAGQQEADDFIRNLTTFDPLLDLMPPESGSGSGSGDGTQGKEQFSAELDEESNYVVLKFSNTQDWLQFTSLVDLETVASTQTNGKVRSLGIGRVLDGPEVLNILLNQNPSTPTE